MTLTETVGSTKEDANYDVQESPHRTNSSG